MPVVTDLETSWLLSCRLTGVAAVHAVFLAGSVDASRTAPLVLVLVVGSELSPLLVEHRDVGIRAHTGKKRIHKVRPSRRLLLFDGTNAPTGTSRLVSTLGVRCWAVKWWPIRGAGGAPMAPEDEEEGPDGKEAAAAQVTSPPGTDLTAGIGRLPVWAFVVIAVLYLVIVQGLGKLLTAGLHTTYAAPTSVNELWRSITVPVLVSLVFVYAVVGVLGWWRPVLTDDRPVRRWVWVIPAIIAVTALAGMNYAGLGKHSAGFIVLFALSMLGVGFAEEGMFRGLGVVTFRVNGFTEAKVALWTCVLFGLAHATNLVSEGPKALLQVLVTAAAGYFFYLTRRSPKGWWFPPCCTACGTSGRFPPSSSRTRATRVRACLSWPTSSW